MAYTIKGNLTIKAPGLARLNNITTPLKKVADALFLSPADDNIYPARALSLSIEKGALSIAYARRLFGKTKIVELRHTPIKEQDYPKPSDAVITVQSAIADFNVKSKGLVLSIPSEWVVFKRVSLPIAAKTNLSTVLAYELDRLTPFSSEEAYYDYALLSEDDSTINIALLSVRAAAVKPYIDELRAVNIQVLSLTSNLLAPINIIKGQGSQEELIFVELKPPVLQSVLISKGAIQSLCRANIDLGNPQSVVNSIVAQIGQCLRDNHRTQAILHMIEPNASLIEALKAQSPVIVRTSEQYVNQIRLSDSRTLYAVGAAFEFLKPQQAKAFNLLSKGNKEKTKRPLLLTALLSLVLICLCTLYLLSPIYIEQQKIKRLSAMIDSQKEGLKESEELKKSIDALKKDIKKIEGFAGDPSNTLTIIKELTTLLPSSAWLTRVRITQKTVEIEGYAESTSGLLTRLEESKYFTNVEFASPSFRDQSMKAERFTMKMQREDVKEEAKVEKK